MSLSLLTRAANGAPLSASQNDANLLAIQTEVNSTEGTVTALTSAFNLCVTAAAFNGYFSGITGGKQQVDYSNVINIPSVYPFRVTQTGIDQVLSVTGGTPYQAIVTLNTVDFDPSSAVNVGAYTWTAPAAGKYMLLGSGQIQLSSGSPTAISMVISLFKNGTSMSNETIDLNSNTGTRIFRLPEFVNLSQGDVITLVIQISQTGNSVWTVSANENTALSGYRVSS